MNRYGRRLPNQSAKPPLPLPIKKELSEKARDLIAAASLIGDDGNSNAYSANTKESTKSNRPSVRPPTCHACSMIAEYSCIICNKRVCDDHTLTIPNTNPTKPDPREFYADTFCSNECWVIAGCPKS